MLERLKRYSLVLCLFVFLFVVIGGGLHLNPGGALAAALSGTPLVIYAFNCWSSATFRQEHARPISDERERTRPQ
jgi:hypothetical protein